MITGFFDCIHSQKWQNGISESTNIYIIEDVYLSLVWLAFVTYFLNMLIDRQQQPKKSLSSIIKLRIEWKRWKYNNNMILISRLDFLTSIVWLDSVPLVFLFLVGMDVRLVSSCPGEPYHTSIFWFVREWNNFSVPGGRVRAAGTTWHWITPMESWEWWCSFSGATPRENWHPWIVFICWHPVMKTFPSTAY